MDDDHIHDGSERRLGLERRQNDRRQEEQPVPLDRRSGDHRREEPERRNRVSEILITPIMIRRP